MTNTLPKVAYFCMEYGLHQDFKMYAGGLGILAGAVIAAGGMAIVAVLVLRALGEWREIEDHERESRASR